MSLKHKSISQITSFCLWRKLKLLLHGTRHGPISPLSIASLCLRSKLFVTLCSRFSLSMCVLGQYLSRLSLCSSSLSLSLSSLSSCSASHSLSLTLLSVLMFFVVSALNSLSVLRRRRPSPKISFIFD